MPGRIESYRDSFVAAAVIAPLWKVKLAALKDKLTKDEEEEKKED